MAITDVLVGAESFNSGNNPATNPAVPAGAGASSLMLIHDVVVQQGGTASQPSTPAGWEILGTHVSTDNDVRLTYFWRAGAPASAPSVAVSGTSSCQHRSVMYAVVGGRITGTINDIFTIGPTSTSTSSSAMGPVSGVTTPEAGCLAFLGVGRDNDLSDGTNIGTPASQTGVNWTMRDAMGTVSANNMAMAAATALVADSGVAITSKSFSISATASDPWVGRMLAIRPEPATAGVPIVNAGADVANHPINTEFTRTATEDPNGATITSRSWTIAAGPAGVGTEIGTAAALAWTPTTAGTYTLRYTATNSVGTSAPDDMSITVPEPSAPGEYWIFEGYTSPGTANAGSFTLATEFYVTEECSAVAIRWPRPTTAVEATEGRIQDVNNNILAGTEVTLVESGTGWQEQRFASSVPLVVGTRYRVLVNYSGNYPAGATWGTGDIVNGPLVCPENANATGGSTTTYVSGTSIAHPTTAVNGNYWSDVVVEVVPADPTAPLWEANAESGDFAASFDEPPGSLDVMSPQTRSIVTSPVRRGTYAYEFAINGTASNGSTRSEAVPRQAVADITPGERWYAASIYLPNGYQTNNSRYDWHTLTQWRHGGSSGSPPLEFNVAEGYFWIGGGDGPNAEPYWDPVSTGVPATTGVWHDFLFHILFDTDPAVGYIEIFHNGIKVLGPVSPPGGTMYVESPVEGYQKIGVYRQPGITIDANSRVYHDEWRMGTTREQVERVDDVDTGAFFSLFGM